MHPNFEEIDVDLDFDTVIEEGDFSDNIDVKLGRYAGPFSEKIESAFEESKDSDGVIWYVKVDRPAFEYSGKSSEVMDLVSKALDGILDNMNELIATNGTYKIAIPVAQSTVEELGAYNDEDLPRYAVETERVKTILDEAEESLTKDEIIDCYEERFDDRLPYSQIGNKMDAIGAEYDGDGWVLN
ncbi:MAG: hypothetical protein ABEJ93_04400 [Candidatus Nanohalobium sp.]